MAKWLKIVACVMVFFGVISLIFLLTARKKAQTAAKQQAVQAISKTAPIKKVTAAPTTSQVASQTASQEKAQAKKTLVRSQWQECKSKTIVANTNLFWNVQISEAIPAGGTYAKGTLDNDTAFPVHVIIKDGIQNSDKIKQMLAVGKKPLLRGTCTDVAADGSVVFEAF